MSIFALPAALDLEMLTHAAEGHPREVGGFLVGPRGGVSTRLVRIDNVADSPDEYCDLDEKQVEALFDELDVTGEAHTAVYHSHPASPVAVPSTPDIRNATDLDTVYLIVAPLATPSVRAWRFVEEQPEDRQAIEIPIRRTGDGDDGDTMRAHLSEGSVVDMTYQSSSGEIRRLSRTRVVRANSDSVVVLHLRRQVMVGLDRVLSVVVLEEAADVASRREFAAKLLDEAASEMRNARIGASRSAIEAAFLAIPGLRPRMGGP